MICVTFDTIGSSTTVVHSDRTIGIFLKISDMAVQADVAGRHQNVARTFAGADPSVTRLATEHPVAFVAKAAVLHPTVRNVRWVNLRDHALIALLHFVTVTTTSGSLQQSMCVLQGPLLPPVGFVG